MYTPKIYHLIKSFIKDIRRPYITISDYESICEHLDGTPEKIMSEPSQRESLIKYLANIGSVVCFRHRDRISILRFGSIIILKSEGCVECECERDDSEM